MTRMPTKFSFRSETSGGQRGWSAFGNDVPPGSCAAAGDTPTRPGTFARERLEGDSPRHRYSTRRPARRKERWTSKVFNYSPGWILLPKPGRVAGGECVPPSHQNGPRQKTFIAALRGVEAELAQADDLEQLSQL